MRGCRGATITMRRSSRCGTSCRARGRRSWRSATSCPCSTSCIRSSTGRRRARTRGRRQGWSGRPRRRRRRTTSRRRRRSSAGRMSTTWRKRKMRPEVSILTPAEQDELELTALVRHRLEEQYANLEHQHEAASLGMWVFLATEVMFFGTLFTALGAYRFQYPEAFDKASEKLNWIIGGTNTIVL